MNVSSVAKENGKVRQIKQLVFNRIIACRRISKEEVLGILTGDLGLQEIYFLLFVSNIHRNSMGENYEPEKQPKRALDEQQKVLMWLSSCIFIRCRASFLERDLTKDFFFIHIKILQQILHSTKLP